jgi:hypothetical protein
MPKRSEMSKAGEASMDALINVVDLLVESRFRIDAMEQILVKTNPVAYELYLDTIENLRAPKTEEVNRVLAKKLKSKLTSEVENRNISRRRTASGNQVR